MAGCLLGLRLDGILQYSVFFSVVFLSFCLIFADVKNCTSVCIHATSTLEDIIYAGSQTELTCVVTSQEIAKKFILVAQKKKLLRHIVLIDCDEVPSSLRSVEVPGLKFHPFARVCEKGIESAFECNEPRGQNDLLSIRYTSGSTGRPKVSVSASFI